MAGTRYSKVVLTLLLIACAGCGAANREVAPVHGRVTLDGQPLPWAGVLFESPGRSPSGGNTDENGNYELIYKRGVMGGSIGSNRVSIHQDTRRVPGPQRFPARYNQETELEREVKPGDNVIDFELVTQKK